jgi:hypothetical protein
MAGSRRDVEADLRQRLAGKGSHDRVVSTAIANDNEPEALAALHEYAPQPIILLTQLVLSVLQLFRAVVTVQLHQQWPTRLT